MGSRAFSVLEEERKRYIRVGETSGCQSLPLSFLSSCFPPCLFPGRQGRQRGFLGKKQGEPPFPEGTEHLARPGWLVSLLLMKTQELLWCVTSLPPQATVPPLDLGASKVTQRRQAGWTISCLHRTFIEEGPWISTGPGAGCLEQRHFRIHLPMGTRLHWAQLEGPASPVEVLPDLGDELPLDDLHSHSLPHWLRGFIGCKHIVIGNGSLILITVHLILHELLGHLYGLVFLSAVVGKRKEHYPLVNVPSL